MSQVNWFKEKSTLNEEELAKYQDEFGEEAFTAGIGAEAVLEMLKNLDLELEKKNLVNYIKETKSKVNEERAIKRLKLIESFIETGQKPEWMIMTVVPGSSRIKTFSAVRWRKICNIRFK